MPPLEWVPPRTWVLRCYLICMLPGMANTAPTRLKRQLGVLGAVMMGLGSVVGTGVFVSIGIAAGIAGPAVILAIGIGAVVAAFNGLSSAQLAANHAVSGGTYEYGYKYLTPVLGFLAGWLFLIAKSASAATAALGFSGYVLSALGVGGAGGGWHVPLALSAVLLLTIVVLTGLQRTSVINVVIVSITLGALAFFIIAGLPEAARAGGSFLTPFFAAPTGAVGPEAVLYAAALMFVAYTGYGRIATMGEEVKEPRRTIPRAIIVTLLVTMVLYVAVAAVAVGSVGAGVLSLATDQRAAPLEVVARTFAFPGAAKIVAVGAVTAMLGVLLNLILGLSRVFLAMGRKRDMPVALAGLNAAGTTPTAAVVVVALIIAALTLLGNVRTTWSFSAFTVLIYYAITNLAALFLPAAGRLYPRWMAVAGLIGCLGLAFFVQPSVWITGLGLMAAGLAWFGVASWLRGRRS